MKGVVSKGNRQLELKNFPDPTPGLGDISAARIRPATISDKYKKVGLRHG
jgi:hypothetical protein